MTSHNTSGQIRANSRSFLVCALLFGILECPAPLWASPSNATESRAVDSTAETAGFLAKRSILEELARVLLLRDYNTRMVLLGTGLLGISAALVGTFTLLRKRALIGDVASHASLPGIAIAFLIAEMWQPGTGRSLTTLSLGAAVAGCLGVMCTVVIRRFTRIPDDAAGAIVLSTFFGFGIVLFTVIQNIPTGQSAGLKHFIVGRAASLVAEDVWVIGEVSVAVLVICLLLFKEFSFLCFDADYASSQGWPVWKLDLLLMALVVSVAVIGEQSVGLLLVIALLIIPPTSARFWTHNLRWLAAISVMIGAISAVVGVVISAVIPRFSTGPIIVLTGSTCFGISLLFGRRLGLLRRMRDNRRVKRRTLRSDLLRAL
ncbi:MAG: iron chelate uptake ABC transporter family permease subunit [Planctomycetaceae bacterium]